MNETMNNVLIGVLLLPLSAGVLHVTIWLVKKSYQLACGIPWVITTKPVVVKKKRRTRAEMLAAYGIVTPKTVKTETLTVAGDASYKPTVTTESKES